MTTFTKHSIENSQGETKEVLTTVQTGYGFIPDLFSYMAEAPTTVQAYLQLNELLTKTDIPMPQLQAALLAVSIENNCDFCRTAHRAIGKSYGANQQTLDELHQGLPVSDAKDNAIVEFTLSMVKNRGWAPESDIQQFLAAGYSRQNILEVVLIITIKTLSNYCNHLTKPEANPELLAML